MNQQGQLEGKYGPYYDVFNVGVNNEEIFNNLKETIDQVLDGYHIVFFGYGYSGSGKSFTLGINNNPDPGIIIRAIDYFTNSSDKPPPSIQIQQIIELYSKNFNLQDTINYGISNANVITYVGFESLQPNLVYVQNAHEKINVDINKNDVINILNDINQIRVHKMRIKPTINNPESSRGHLFITLKIGNGYLTICDMGGREDPHNIWDIENVKQHLIGYQKVTSAIGVTYTDVQKSMHNKIGVVRTTPKLVTDALTVIDTCKEGYFINETLNHMRLFFQHKMGLSPQINLGIYPSLGTDRDKYSPENFILSPETRWRKRIGMYPILEMFDQMKGSSLDGSLKPTKFIVFGCVRTESEEKYKKASIDTLNFATKLTGNLTQEERDAIAAKEQKAKVGAPVTVRAAGLPTSDLARISGKGSTVTRMEYTNPRVVGVGGSKKKHSHHTIKRRPINESAIKHKTKRIVILPQKGKFTIKIRR